MQLWAGSSTDFIHQTTHNQIAGRLADTFFRHFHFKPSDGEVASWQNSLRAVSLMFGAAALNDHGVLLEYQLPLTSNRLDCLVCGHGPGGGAQAVIIELKQWERCDEADGENLVATWLGGGVRDTLHPSAQVRQYRLYLEDTHTAFYEEPAPVGLAACAYLHNYPRHADDMLFAPKFAALLAECPAFTADDVDPLTTYLRERLALGSGLDVLRRVQESRFRPSKKLMDHVADMIDGQPAYVLLDEQLVVFDKVLDCAREGARSRGKQVIIIRGGPGTGKSVIALNLMSRLLRQELNVHYATGSRAFTETLRRIIGNRGEVQFKYFNSYRQAAVNEIDVLICDEAHRLRKTSADRFTPKSLQTGLPQIEEILRAAQLSVFFIDDKQVVRPDEIGSVEHIREHSSRLGCRVSEYQLEAQFRCAGSDGFINWVNNTLGVERTANVIWDGNEGFDFRIFSSPEELDQAIRGRAAQGFSSRLTAGFCWPWSTAQGDGTLVPDVRIGDFHRPWNAKPEARKLAKDIPKAQLWAHDPNGLEQVGCVYTAQGFEFDYVGVIFGLDLRYNLDAQAWEGHRESSHDNVVKRGKDRFVDLVKNTYRVLLSRGLRGCYVHFMDKDTERFVKSRLNSGAAEPRLAEILAAATPSMTIPPPPDKPSQSEPFRHLPPGELRPFENCVPIYDLQVAAGRFSDARAVDEVGPGDETHRPQDFTWVELPAHFRPRPGMFVAQVVGESMNRRVPNGAWCLFQRISAGTRNGKVVLAQHRDISDPDTGGQFTVKIYESEKALLPDGSWHHSKIVLKPDSTDLRYQSIILNEAQVEEVRLIAELLAVVG